MYGAAILFPEHPYIESATTLSKGIENLQEIVLGIALATYKWLPKNLHKLILPSIQIHYQTKNF